MIDKKLTSYAKNLRINQTDVEKLLWFHLRARRLEGIKFRRQQPIGKYIVDFVSLENRLIIELDGGQHNEDNKAKNDHSRTEGLQKEGFRVIRFWNNDVLENLEGVLEQIQLALTLTLSPNGRGNLKKI